MPPSISTARRHHDHHSDSRPDDIVLQKSLEGDNYITLLVAPSRKLHLRLSTMDERHLRVESAGLLGKYVADGDILRFVNGKKMGWGKMVKDYMKSDEWNEFIFQSGTLRDQKVDTDGIFLDFGDDEDVLNL